MEIIVVFLNFLLFYWNIFVILRKKYRIMEYIFSKKKLVVLKHLADGEQHEEAPAGLTEAQFSVALSELKAYDMVKVNVDEVGKVVSSQIKIKGLAALDDLESLEKAMLNHILEKKKLTKYSYEPPLKSKACYKCLYFTKIISALCCYLEYFSYLYTIN